MKKVELERTLDAAKDLHRPRSTGRYEYRTGPAGEVLGVERTFNCPVMCEPTWYFEGDGCATWKVLNGEQT